MNWKAIESSDAWQEQIVPWIKELRQDALEDMAHGEHDDRIKYWQGYAAALEEILTRPQEMIEAERLVATQEKEQSGRADNARRDWLSRVRRTINIGS